MTCEPKCRWELDGIHRRSSYSTHVSLVPGNKYVATISPIRTYKQNTNNISKILEHITQFINAAFLYLYSILLRFWLMYLRWKTAYIFHEKLPLPTPTIFAYPVVVAVLGSVPHHL
jgi:hypothetical protein